MKSIGRCAVVFRHNWVIIAPRGENQLQQPKHPSKCQLTHIRQLIYVELNHWRQTHLLDTRVLPCVCLSVRLSILFVCPSVCLSPCPSLHPICLTTRVSVSMSVSPSRLFVHPCVCLSVRLFIPSVHACVCLSVRLSISSVCPPVCLSLCPSLHNVCLSTRVSSSLPHYRFVCPYAFLQEPL